LRIRPTPPSGKKKAVTVEGNLSDIQHKIVFQAEGGTVVRTHLRIKGLEILEVSVL
jgi:hypothetical protein